MKKTIIRYGLFGAISGATLFLSGILLGHELDYSLQEIFGYLTITAGLSFIYFGIKHFRDRQNKGNISFGQGFMIGIAITILVGIGIGIADYIYTSILNPNFAQEYLEVSLENLKQEYSGESLIKESEKLKAQVEQYSSSLSLALIMFVTVLIMGSAISVISALVLKTNKS